jgi:hypothetical protein
LIFKKRKLSKKCENRWKSQKGPKSLLKIKWILGVSQGSKDHYATILVSDLGQFSTPSVL